MEESCLIKKRSLVDVVTGGNENVFLGDSGNFMLASIDGIYINDVIFKAVIEYIDNTHVRDLLDGKVCVKIIRSVHCLVKGAFERGLFKGISDKVMISGGDFFKRLISKYVNALGLTESDDGVIVFSDKLVRYEQGDKNKIYLCCITPGDVCDDDRYFLNFDNQYTIGMTCKWTDYLPKCIRYFKRIPVAFDEAKNYKKSDEYSFACIDKNCDCSKQVVEHDLEYMVVSAIMGVSYPKMVESYDLDHGGDDVCESCESVKAVETTINVYCVARWCFGECNVQASHPMLNRNLYDHMRCLNYDVKFSSDNELYNFIVKIYDIGEDFSVSEHFVNAVKELYRRSKALYKDRRIPWGTIYSEKVPEREVKKGKNVKKIVVKKKKRYK